MSPEEYVLDRSALTPDKIYFYAGNVPTFEWDELCENEIEAGTEVRVLMCPIDYWNKFGHIIDKYLSIRRRLPEYMSEETRCEYLSESNLEQTRSDLLRLGFLEDPIFSAWCKQHDPFV